jgi:hypothetical protein
MKKIVESKQQVGSMFGLMEVLNNLPVGDSQKFIANNQLFVIVKVQDDRKPT